MERPGDGADGSAGRGNGQPAGRGRSGPWYGTSGGAAADVASFIHRAFTKAMGYDDADLQRPVIGVCNTYSELNHCNRGLKDVAEAVKRGVLQAGGLPLEFPTISIGEVFVSPTSMFFRNLAAMDTEEMIRAQPLDRSEEHTSELQSRQYLVCRLLL